MVQTFDIQIAEERKVSYKWECKVMRAELARATGL